MNENETKGKKNGPRKVYGKSVRISAWNNNNGNGDFITFKLERRYKDGDGQWKSSSSFTLSQLLRLQALIGKAIGDYVDQDNGQGGIER